MRLRRLLLLSLLPLMLPLAAGAIDFACLGATGGDLGSDISCFAVRPGPAGPFTLLLDGGSLDEGAAALARAAGTLPADADPESRALALADLLHPMEGALLTHAHLDHVTGFTIAQTTLLHLKRTRNRPPFRVVASPETFARLDRALHDGDVWGSFFGPPERDPVLLAEPLAETGETRIGGFRVTRFLLDHKVPADAFLLENGSDEAFLYCGDSAPMPRAFWARFHPLLAAGRLRGVALECSFPSADHELAARTAHLTPDTLLLELSALAGVEPDGSVTPPLAPDAAAALARRVAERLPIPVLVNHVKPLQWRAVTAELDRLAAAGLRLVVARRGVCYSF